MERDVLSSQEMVAVLWGLQPGLEPPVLVAFDTIEERIWVEQKLVLKMDFGLSTNIGLNRTFEVHTDFGLNTSLG